MNDRIAADWAAPAHIIAGTTLRHAREDALPGRPCWLRQVHGNRVISAGPFEEPPEADASIKGSDPFLCVVRTADCLPVLFCARDGSRFGAAHAGWRGLAAGVLEATVAALGVPAGSVLAWLGPAIGAHAYEVDAAVRDAFVGADPGAATAFVATRPGHWRADLYALARRRLARVGVDAVYGGGLCTASDSARFYSYRRDGVTGRMASLVWRHGSAPLT